MKNARQAHGMMVVATLLISTSFPVVASIAGAMDSLVLTLLRFALASLLFLPLVLWRNRREMIPTWRSLGRYALLSAPLVGFFFAMFEALRTTNAVNTAAWITFGPCFAALIALVLVGERTGGQRLVALITGMVGAVWVVFRGQVSRLVELDLAVGDGTFLAGTVAIGLYTVLIKRLHRGEPMVVMTFWTLVTGTGWLLLLGGGELAAVSWNEVEPRVLGALVYLAIFTTLVSFLLTQKAVTVIGPTRVMAYTYLNPALVALLAWALGDGAIGWRSLPGVALTLASTVVLQRCDLPASLPGTSAPASGYPPCA